MILKRNIIIFALNYFIIYLSIAKNQALFDYSFVLKSKVLRGVREIIYCNFDFFKYFK